MSSFHGILTLAGQDFPIVRCTYEFSQATGERGRVTAKVRSGMLTLDLDVSESDELLVWAADPNKKLSGYLVFHATDSPVASEKLEFEDGFCVAYDEIFYAGAVSQGAYRCMLQISAAKLTLGMVEKDNTWIQTR